MQAEAVASKLKKIREAYIKQLPAQLEGIRASYSDFVLGEKGSAPLEDLHRRIHTMKGACASFRLSLLSSVAMTGEYLAMEAMQSETAPDRFWHQKMQEQFARMEHEISAIDPQQGMELQIQELAIAAEEPTERERKLVYLCDDDSFQRLTLATQIGCFGFEVLSFGETEQLVNAVQSAPPDVIVMDIIFPDRPLGGAEIMKTIQSGRTNPVPTVFISSQGSLAMPLVGCACRVQRLFRKTDQYDRTMLDSQPAHLSGKTGTVPDHDR